LLFTDYFLNMNKVIKNSIAIALLVLASLSIYFGAILPFKKAQSYIYFIKTTSDTAQTLDELKIRLDKVVEFYSPIGREEVVRYLSNDFLNIMLYANNPEVVDRTMVQYIEPHMLKYDVRHLIAMGELYKGLWVKYKKTDDLVKSEDYYEKALSLAPKLPPVLYNAFDLYQEAGNKERAREIGEMILKYWPEDKKVRQL